MRVLFAFVWLLMVGVMLTATTGWWHILFLIVFFWQGAFIIRLVSRSWAKRRESVQAAALVVIDELEEDTGIEYELKDPDLWKHG